MGSSQEVELIKQRLHTQARVQVLSTATSTDCNTVSPTGVVRGFEAQLAQFRHQAQDSVLDRKRRASLDHNTPTTQHRTPVNKVNSCPVHISPPADEPTNPSTNADPSVTHELVTQHAQQQLAKYSARMEDILSNLAEQKAELQRDPAVDADKGHSALLQQLTRMKREEAEREQQAQQQQAEAEKELQRHIASLAAEQARLVQDREAMAAERAAITEEVRMVALRHTFRPPPPTLCADVFVAAAHCIICLLLSAAEGRGRSRAVRPCAAGGGAASPRGVDYHTCQM